MTPGKQQMVQAVSISGKSQKFKGHFWVWKWECCGQEETSHWNQEKRHSSLCTCTHTSEWVFHTSLGSMISLGAWPIGFTWMKRRARLSDPPDVCLKLYHRVWFKSLSTELPYRDDKSQHPRGEEYEAFRVYLGTQVAFYHKKILTGYFPGIRVIHVLKWEDDSAPIRPEGVWQVRKNWVGQIIVIQRVLRHTILSHLWQLSAQSGGGGREKD